MKRNALLGVTTLVVLAITAAIGVNLASPTALCLDEPKEGICKTSGYIEEAETSSAKFETSIGIITCKSYLEAEPTEPATPKGLPQKGEAFTSFSACTKEGGATCTASALHFSQVSFNWVSGVSGSLEFTTTKTGPPQVKLTCEKSIECTYTLESTYEVVGGKPATVVASKEVLGSASGTLCPGSGAAIGLTATYKSPTAAAYVGQTTPPVNLCQKNETPCSAGNTYSVPTSLTASLEAGVKARLRVKITEESETTEYTVGCDVSTVEGKVSSAKWPAPGEISVVTFGECGGACAVKQVKAPFAASVEATGGGNGTISWAPRIRVRCIGAYKCTYETGNLTTSIVGGVPAKLPVSLAINKLVTAESDTKCGSEAKWEGAYVFTKPEASGEAKMWVVREGV